MLASIVSQYLQPVSSQYLIVHCFSVISSFSALFHHYLTAMSQVAWWCPDVKGHLSPLSGMNAREASNLFSGVPPWMLSYWACTAGAVSKIARVDAVDAPAKCFWNALDEHLMRKPEISMLREGGERYVPVPGVAALVERATVPEPTAKEATSAIAGKSRGRTRKRPTATPEPMADAEAGLGPAIASTPQGRTKSRPATSRPTAKTPTGAAQARKDTAASRAGARWALEAAGAAGSQPQASHAGSPGIHVISTPPECHHYHNTCSSNASQQHLASMSS